ncbi:hypothetical protein [Geomonas agri]|uniref:hypothetical protein n=1 Tax=Geomonas agri TaxID=2873702 RepID=UPI001CD32D3C|nr:hypothetical protein [Geomonas agri]
MTKVSNKKNLYVADEDLLWFDKAKELFPDVSLSKLIAELLRETCMRKEAEQARMVEQTVYKGKESLENEIFIGQEFRFDGIELGYYDDKRDNVKLKAFLTKKGKFLVAKESSLDGELHYFFNVYDTYSDVSKEIPVELQKRCAEYLNKNSTLRTYEKLDI